MLYSTLLDEENGGIDFWVILWYNKLYIMVRKERVFMDKDLAILNTFYIPPNFCGLRPVTLSTTTDSVLDDRGRKLSNKKLLDYWDKAATYPDLRIFLYPYCKNLITKGENESSQDVYIVEMKCTVCSNVYREAADINEPPLHTVCPCCGTNFETSDLEEAEIVKTVKVALYHT